LTSSSTTNAVFDKALAIRMTKYAAVDISHGGISVTDVASSALT